MVDLLLSQATWGLVGPEHVVVRLECTRLPRRHQKAGTERGTGKMWAGMGS